MLQKKMYEIYKEQKATNVKQGTHSHYSFTEEDIKEQNLTSAQRVME